MAFALHGAALWLLEGPDVSPQGPSRIPGLRVAVEAPSTAASADEEPGKVVPPPDLQPRESRERDRASPGDRGRPPAVAEKDADGDAVPDVDPHELLRDLAPADETPATGFGRHPETHPVFQPQRLVRAEEPPAPWSRGIWRRSAVDEQTRFKTTDGRNVWIRRYDNGDIQVCERAPDDLLGQWDDHLPFVCER